jgi:hypothetical protein
MRISGQALPQRISRRPLLAPQAGQWAAARRVPLCSNPQSASDVEVVELRASPGVCVTAFTCRRRAHGNREGHESEPARFQQDALLIRDSECNKHAKQESYFCAVADGGWGGVAEPRGTNQCKCPPTGLLMPSVLTSAHALDTHSRCRCAVYFRYCVSHNRHSLPTLLRLIST